MSVVTIESLAMPPRSVQKARDFKTKITSQEFRMQRCSDLWETLTRMADMSPPDLRIICKDGISVACHQSIIAGSSLFLRELFIGVSLKSGDGTLKVNEDVTVFVPDIESSAVVGCLSLLYDGVAHLYTGATNSSNPETRNKTMELKDLWKNVFRIDLVKLSGKGGIDMQPFTGRVFRDFLPVPKKMKEREKLEPVNCTNYFEDEKLLIKRVNDEIEQLDKCDSLSEDIPDVHVNRIADFRTPTPPSMQKKILNQRSSQKRSYPTQLEERGNEDMPTPSPKIKKQKQESKSSHLSFLRSDNMTEQDSLTPKSSKKKEMSIEEQLQKALEDVRAENIEFEKRKEKQKVEEKEVETQFQSKEKGYSESDMKNIFRNKALLETPAKLEEPLPKIQLKSTPLFSVEIAHCCVICGGKDKDGKIDKEASNLSLSDPKRLKEHYCRHFYTEGKLFDLLPLEEGNKKEDGSILDEFGRMYKYKCDKKSVTRPGEPCWKSKKRPCGYKEIALHHAAEHGLFETIIEADQRPEIQELVKKLEEARNKS